MFLRLPPLPVADTCRNLNLRTTLSRHFHSSPTWRSERADHYSVLGLEHNASQTAIKKQFYALSKTHHPDHNPDDPTASERFMKISEAYAVLGQPDKRSKYDQETRGPDSDFRSSSRRGSHSSSAFGSRPASGLSKRRTHFRGPPPSFYRSGGWGAHGAKRQRQAEEAAAAAGSASRTGSEAREGGYGYGQGQAGWDNDVPHFDQHGHRRTQEQQERRWMLRRRPGDDDATYGPSSMVIQFFLIGGIVVAALSLPALFERNYQQPKRKPEQ